MRHHGVTLLAALASLASGLRIQPRLPRLGLSRLTQRGLPFLTQSAAAAPAVEVAGPVRHADFLVANILDRDLAPLTGREAQEAVESARSLGGMQGKALQEGRVYPTKKEVLSAIPEECFRRHTGRSLAYAAGSVAVTGACVLAGCQFLPQALTLGTLPLWIAYGFATGTAATGCWVVAHECGHGAFSDNKVLQDAVGYALHSALLVPYFSWQRTHAVHHSRTNHMSEGETHVPPIVGNKESDMQLVLRRRTGFLWPWISMFLHLVVGWPAYILLGATGGYKYGQTSHFNPWGHSGTRLPGGKSLFPSPALKRRVLFSDVGILATAGALAAWGASAGWQRVLALYGLPYLFTNAWLVLLTWLQHTDVDVPHFDENEYSWVKGAFHTIDRPYGPVLNLLHHGIGSTHVLHHICSAVPHYHAWKATRAIKDKFPELYLYDPTPIHQALWRVAKNCVAVRKTSRQDGAYIYVRD